MNAQAKPAAVAAAYAPPAKEVRASVQDIITVTASLSGLLAEETGFMKSMQLAGVGGLQERKLKLTGMLERYTRYLSNHAEVLENITAEERAELKKVVDNFNAVMRKNHDTLMVARAVNNTIVKCITQTVLKKEANPIYNARGNAVNCKTHRPVSVTLNQMA